MTRGRAARRSVAVTAALLAIAAVADAAQPTSSILLEWDPNPESEIAGYIVYVGSAPRVYVESIDVGNSTQFNYAIPSLGQRYYFAVSAYFSGGIEGPLSNEVIVETEAGNARVDAARPRCASGRDCAGAEVIAAGIGSVQSLAPLDDGRVAVLERHRVVRIISSDGRRALSALFASSADVRYTALIADPRFESTRFMYVGVVQRDRAGGFEFGIARYRELNDTLGEGAVVVDGLAVTGDAHPAFAVDGVGHIYVSMPLDPSRRTPYGGRILRFDAHGASRGSRGASPILSDGYARPTGLAWDGALMWSIGAGADHSMPASEVVALSSSDSAQPDAAVQRAIAADGVRSLRAFAVRRIPRDGTTSVVWLDDRGRLGRVHVRDDGSFDRQTVGLDPGAAVGPIAIGARDEIYAALGDGHGGFRVIRLPDQTGRF